MSPPVFSLEHANTALHYFIFSIALFIKNGGTFSAYKMDVRLYFKRTERDEEGQGKMQGTKLPLNFFFSGDKTAPSLGK